MASKNPDEAGLLLGIAYLRANNKPEAAKAFQTVNKNPTMAHIAKMWLMSMELEPRPRMSDESWRLQFEWLHLRNRGACACQFEVDW